MENTWLVGKEGEKRKWGKGNSWVGAD